eukprot:SAG11_NODE_5241_length_1619_cov_1.717105_1_plen_92_part_00
MFWEGGVAASTGGAVLAPLGRDRPSGAVGSIAASAAVGSIAAAAAPVAEGYRGRAGAVAERTPTVGGASSVVHKVRSLLYSVSCADYIVRY